MQPSPRRKKGNALIEFGPAMVVFVCFILTPLLDLGFIPVRYLICTGVINEYAHRLSLSEKRSDCYAAGDNWWRDFLLRCGITVHEPSKSLIICGRDEGDRLVVRQGETVPAEWLPNGSKGPCLYSLEVSLNADIPPLVSSSHGLPGLTGPITMTFASRSNWENFGRDPETRLYYVNE